jgi:hypothetical protein
MSVSRRERSPFTRRTSILFLLFVTFAHRFDVQIDDAFHHRRALLFRWRSALPIAHHSFVRHGLGSQLSHPRARRQFAEALQNIREPLFCDGNTCRLRWGHGRIVALAKRRVKYVAKLGGAGASRRRSAIASRLARVQGRRPTAVRCPRSRRLAGNLHRSACSSCTSLPA